MLQPPFFGTCQPIVQATDPSLDCRSRQEGGLGRPELFHSPRFVVVDGRGSKLKDRRCFLDGTSQRKKTNDLDLPLAQRLLRNALFCSGPDRLCSTFRLGFSHRLPNCRLAGGQEFQKPWPLFPGSPRERQQSNAAAGSSRQTTWVWQASPCWHSFSRQGPPRGACRRKWRSRPGPAAYRLLALAATARSTRAINSEAGISIAGQTRNRTSTVGDLLLFSKWLM